MFSCFLGWTALASGKIEYFLIFIFYFILHGQMHTNFRYLGVTFDLIGPQMQIFIRCLPRRSASFSPYIQIGRQSTYGLNQNYDWDTHYSFHPWKKKWKIFKLPEIRAVEPKTKRKWAEMDITNEPVVQNWWFKSLVHISIRTVENNDLEKSITKKIIIWQRNIKPP